MKPVAGDDGQPQELADGTENSVQQKPTDYASHYASIGLALVAIPPRSKAPNGNGWQKHPITTPGAAREHWQRHPNDNMGLVHAHSGTATLDIDHLDHARAVFADFGIDLDALIAANPYRIRGQRGEKPVYRVPAGEKLAIHKLAWPADPSVAVADGEKPKAITIFELRANGGQDVLPPSIHPSGVQYEWVNDAPQSYEDLPELPAELLDLWLNWDAYRPEMVALCPWAAHKPPQPAPALRGHDHSGDSVIDAYNNRYSAHDLLPQHGYKARGPRRYLSPHSSSGMPGVVVFEDGRVFSHHGGDLFSDGHSHDAFDLCRLLEHGGDWKQAIKSAAELLGITAQPRPNKRTQDTVSGTHNNSIPVASNGVTYQRENNTLVVYRKNRAGDVTPTTLTNFDARIIAAETRDDGVERSGFYKIIGSLTTVAGKVVTLPELTVSTAEYPSLNWVSKHWGAFGASIEAGQSLRAHAEVAIHRLSFTDGNIQTYTAYAHTGWRKLEVDGQPAWAYLHGNGAIGPAGVVPGVTTALPGDLERYVFPIPPTGEALKTAFYASLDILNVAPDVISVPLLLNTYSAVFGGQDITLGITGATGSQKSELAALSQQHYGAAMNRKALPGDWEAPTMNALLGLGFAAKDAIFVIDDLAPNEDRRKNDEIKAKAAQIIRAAGNLSSKTRANPDGTPKAGKPIRAAVLWTGEDLPPGHSVRGRSFIIGLCKGDVNLSQLTVCQQKAESGLYAASMAGFICWLAPQLEQLQADLKRYVIAERSNWPADHDRTSDGATRFAFVATVLARFALETGTVTTDQATEFEQRCLVALRLASGSQREYQAQADPIQRLLAMLPALCHSKQAHVADVGGADSPRQLESYGYELRSFGAGDKTEMRAHAHGERLGWVKHGKHGNILGLYLIPDVVYAEIQRLASKQHATIAMTAPTLWRRLAERGIIATATEGKDTRYVVKQHTPVGKMRVLRFMPAYVGLFEGDESNDEMPVALAAHEPDVGVEDALEIDLAVS
jgi:hypothetical protein